MEYGKGKGREEKKQEQKKHTIDKEEGRAPRSKAFRIRKQKKIAHIYAKTFIQ